VSDSSSPSARLATADPFITRNSRWAAPPVFQLDLGLTLSTLERQFAIFNCGHKHLVENLPHSLNSPFARVCCGVQVAHGASEDWK
jgi:hypothetical protein